MRKTTKALLASGLLAAGVGYSGFPKRVGLTKAQALVSMPGDLVLPSAEIQVDRMVTAEASPQSVWPYVIQLRHDYKDLWDAPVATEIVEEPDLVVWRTGSPAKEGEEELFDATAAVQLQPGPDGTTQIHVRERYKFYSTKGRFAAHVVTTASAVTIWGRLRKIRSASEDMAGGSKRFSAF